MPSESSSRLEMAPPWMMCGWPHALVPRRARARRRERSGVSDREYSSSWSSPASALCSRWCCSECLLRSSGTHVVAPSSPAPPPPGAVAAVTAADGAAVAAVAADGGGGGTAVVLAESAAMTATPAAAAAPTIARFAAVLNMMSSSLR